MTEVNSMIRRIFARLDQYTVYQDPRIQPTAENFRHVYAIYDVYRRAGMVGDLLLADLFADPQGSENQGSLPPIVQIPSTTTLGVESKKWFTPIILRTNTWKAHDLKRRFHWRIRILGFETWRFMICRTL